MNIFEMIFFLADVALGVFVGGWALHQFGWVAGVLGFVLGVAIIPGTILLFPRLRRRLQRGKGIW